MKVVLVPAYHPAMMLKVIVYAYSLGIYSSRGIAQELKTDTAFMFLSGLQASAFSVPSMLLCSQTYL